VISVPSFIRLLPSGPGIDKSLAIPVAASDVIETTLTITSDATSLPTLTSVERVIGRLANVGLVLADAKEANQIARLVNKKFLPIEQEKWKDQELRLRAMRADGDGAPESLRAVADLRMPVVDAAESVLTAGGAYGTAERRLNENRLVDSVTQSAVKHKSTWLKYGAIATGYLGKTVMDSIVDQLIGIPMSDMIRSAVRNTRRRIF
jgi:hypothetical protein